MTVRAAARGLIDFTQARINDVAWWRKTNTLINPMLDEANIQVLHVLLAKQLGLVGNGMLVDESFKSAQTQSNELGNKIINLMRPWASKDLGELQQGQTGGMVAMYKRLLGDPADPVYQQKM